MTSSLAVQIAPLSCPDQDLLQPGPRGASGAVSNTNWSS